MTGDQPEWLLNGRGQTPQVQWSITTEGALVGLEWTRETGEVLAADETGSLFLVDRMGRFQFVSHGFRDTRALAVADTGENFAVLIGETQVSLHDRKGESLWTIDLPEVCLTIALDPRGNYLLVCLADGRNVVLDRNRNTTSRFETVRPLAMARFLVEVPEIVAAAEYGLICRHQLDGEQLWADKTWSNVGDITVTGDGDAVWIAGFNHGLQLYDADGQNRASLVTEGTINHVSVSYQGDRLAAATIEQHLFWLDGDGELVWGTKMDTEVRRVIANPLGHRLLFGLDNGRVVCLQWNNAE